jgi:hypothetical protein
MSRRSLLLALLAIPVFFLAAIPAVAKKATASKAPVVTSIKPMKLKIGEKLTIHGRNFIKGRHKDTIVFMGAGKRVVWVKADTASKNTLTVKLPTKLAVLLADKTGKQQPTRLLIRVIARKSGRAFTKRSKSPIVSPSAILPGAAQAEACPGVSNPGGDSDGDFLSNGLELALGTNPCKADSDGDGVSDGYEYQAALDLNRNANSSAIPWPYPGKRPYPNPLDPSDANTDFDGDSLTLSEEYTASFAWLLGIDPQRKLRTFLPYVPNPNPNNDVMVVSYSDGDQTTNTLDGAGNLINPQGNPIGDPTGPPAPCAAPEGTQTVSTQSGFDVNGNGVIGDPGDVLSYQGATGFVDNQTTPLGWMNEFNQNSQADCFLSDDEKDIDGDGLSNYTEAHGPLMGQSWWTSFVPKAGTFTIGYTGTNWLDPDTDGDGIPDGADDQDHDGYTNIEESMPLGDPAADATIQAKSTWHFPVEGDNPNVDAFDPCLPNVMSPACPRHPAAGAPYAPFADSSPPASYSTWPRP